MTLRPLGDRILVRKAPPEEKTQSGLYIPDDVKSGPVTGTVVSVGPGLRDGDKVVPLSVEVGQQILFPEYGGTDVEADGEALTLMREADVLAVIES